MAPLEPWEKVLVNFEKFSQTAHGKQSCIDCHGGSSQGEGKENAHAGMNPSPSADAQAQCGECHEAQVAAYPNALHNTQAGYWTQIDARSSPENHPALEEMFGNHCATCHTTCGECHINQPDNVGGGLFNGHVFEKTPPMTRSCTACHGSRVGNEYLGKNEGLPGDVHFREGRMNCVKCHSGADLHAENADPASASHRYAGAESPKCTDCHPSALPGGDSNPMHQSHGESLSCQVCHSVTYTSCDGCHVAISEKSGKPFFETEATYATFFIGRNPNPGPDRPYAFTPVRHIPISPTSYQYYGENLLPNFDALPTWAYATPHNIQRNTPQNASCEACHGNPQYFLTADKVAAEERKANENVIVSAPPPSLEILRELLASAPRQPRAHGEIKSVTCDVCHASGMGGIPQNPASHASFSAASCAGCHKRP